MGFVLWYKIMKVTDTADYIRQQYPGQFRSPEDGEGPFTRVNGQEFNNMKEQKKSAVYITDKEVVSFERDTNSDSTKFFDFDVGIKCKTVKVEDTSEEEKSSQQYKENQKEQVTIKEEKSVDLWA